MLERWWLIMHDNSKIRNLDNLNNVTSYGQVPRTENHNNSYFVVYQIHGMY